MLDDLNELRTLQQVLARGSLTAAQAMGVSLAVVSKRLGTLERRAGVRLVDRTTRSLSPTEEGRLLLVEVERALEAIGQGEEVLAAGRDAPVGTLRVSAPVSFGRRHVAPVLGDLVRRHPQLSVALSLDDRLEHRPLGPHRSERENDAQALQSTPWAGRSTSRSGSTARPTGARPC